MLGNPWIARPAQSTDPYFEQRNPWIVPIHGLRITYTCVFLPSTCAVPSLELCTCIHTIDFNAFEIANQSVVLDCCCGLRSL